MESTNTLRIVNEHGWRMGFANLFQVASGSFWRTKKWLIQIGIWLLCLNGMLASFLWQIPADMLSRAAASLGNIKTMAAAEDNPIAFAVMMFLMVCSMALPIAAIVAGQEAIIGERQSGTVAWLLSKPVSRPAFILSRLAVSAVGMLVTAVVIPGAVAYGMLSLKIGAPWPIAGFLAAMGMSFLKLIFLPYPDLHAWLNIHQPGACLGDRPGHGSGRSGLPADVANPQRFHSMDFLLEYIRRCTSGSCFGARTSPRNSYTHHLHCAELFNLCRSDHPALPA